MTEVCRQNHKFPLDCDQTGFAKKNVWAVEEPPVTPITTLQEYAKYRVRQWEEMYHPPNHDLGTVEQLRAHMQGMIDNFASDTT